MMIDQRKVESSKKMIILRTGDSKGYLKDGWRVFQSMLTLILSVHSTKSLMVR